jgi:hypothetical protein
MSAMDEDKKQINCFRCRHFYVTWEMKFPRGCRAMGFKSREMPSQAVLEASGMPCMRFERRVVKTR